MTNVTYRKNIKGKKFNKLTVISFSHLNKTRHAVWKCLCDCGNETFAQSRLLINGAKKSCGCLQNQIGKNSGTWKGCGDLSYTHYSKIIREAKIRNITFDISIKFLWELYEKQNKKCALSGEPIKFSSKVHIFDRTASLDRIDSNKGYTKDNVQWVHKDINMMKQTHNNEEFLLWCKKITKHNLGVKEIGTSLILSR